MALTEEPSVSPLLLPKKQKIKKLNMAEQVETSVCVIKNNSTTLKPVNNSDTATVRLKKRKKRKIDVDSFYVEESSAESDSTSILNQVNVNDNVDSIPPRMKKLKQIQLENDEQIHDLSDNLKPYKKVSFNDSINSAPTHDKKSKKFKLVMGDVKEHPPPKSILKHVDHQEYNKPVSKKKSKKKKNTKSKVKNVIADEDNVKKLNIPLTTSISKQEKAIVYLETWKNNKNNWKFEKLTQMWLLKNMLDGIKVSCLFPASMFLASLYNQMQIICYRSLKKHSHYYWNISRVLKVLRKILQFRLVKLLLRPCSRSYLLANRMKVWNFPTTELDLFFNT